MPHMRIAQSSQFREPTLTQSSGFSGPSQSVGDTHAHQDTPGYPITQAVNAKRLPLAAYYDTLQLMSPLSSRLLEVMSLRDLNPSSWAKLAGVPRATVRLAIKQDRDSMESRTLAALAKAADVSFEWLATGRFSVEIAEDWRYPSRPRALAAAKIVGYPQSTIAAVASVDDLAADPGVDYWLSLLRLKQLEHYEPLPEQQSR